MKFPWSDTSDPLALAPGNYAVEITHAEEVQAKTSGARMWNVTLKSISFGCKLCHDRMMVEGGGINITAAKLSALGFEKGEDVEAGHLLGKRTWVTVKDVPASGEYQRKLEVDISAKGSNCGYWKEKPGVLVEAVVAPDQPPF